MARHSEDLRAKVVEFIKKGHTHKEAAEIFGVYEVHLHMEQDG